jgi:hypothetical protein
MTTLVRHFAPQGKIRSLKNENCKTNPRSEIAGAPEGVCPKSGTNGSLGAKRRCEVPTRRKGARHVSAEEPRPASPRLSPPLFIVRMVPLPGKLSSAAAPSTLVPFAHRRANPGDASPRGNTRFEIKGKLRNEPNKCFVFSPLLEETGLFQAVAALS